MKIIFQNTSNDSWLAGATVLEMLFHALRRLDPPARPRLALTAWSNQPAGVSQALANLADELITLPGPLPPEFDLTGYLRQAGGNVFFSIPTATAPRISLPRMLWIYDFQHVHLADWFDPAEAARRTRLFAANAESATRIMVNSQAVYDDLRARMPAHAGKTRILPFVPWLPPDARRVDPRAILGRYGLPEKFFFMPNRFSHRKNHRLVLDALRRLQAKKSAPVVVCTGQDGDANDPGNLAQLLRQRDDWGLARQFITLGAVPRNDLFLLMRQSICLLTATLFEGFGLSVAEARFLGKTILASDLPVLREHNPPAIVFFNPTAPDELARKMAAIWRQAAPGPAPALEAAAAIAHDQAQIKFARDFMALALESAVARPSLNQPLNREPTQGVSAIRCPVPLNHYWHGKIRATKLGDEIST